MAVRSFPLNSGGHVISDYQTNQLIEPMMRALERKEYEDELALYAPEFPEATEKSPFAIELSDAKKTLAENKYQEYLGEINYLNSLKK